MAMLRQQRGARRLGRGVLAAVCLLLGLGGVLPRTASAQPPPPIKKWVLVVPGGTGLIHAFQQCVEHYLQQGLPLARASGQCMAIGVLNQSSNGHYGLNASVFGDEAPSASTIQCNSLTMDPQLAGMIHREPDPSWSPAPPFGHLGSQFDTMYESYMQMLDLLSVELTKELVALREQKKHTTDPVQSQILQDNIDNLDGLIQSLTDKANYDWYRDSLTEYEKNKKENPPSPPGDYPLPDPDAPQPAEVDGGHVSACENLSNFVNECRLSGWETAPCEIFLTKLEGCGDPTITDPDPDAAPCGSEEVSQEEARQVAFEVCSENTLPGPDSDPCSGSVAFGMAYGFSYGKNNPNQPICGNPFAYTEGGACTPTYTVLVSPQTSVDKVIAAAQERLGGPVFIRPAPSPLDPNGGDCAADPRCSP